MEQDNIEKIEESCKFQDANEEIIEELTIQNSFKMN